LAKPKSRAFPQIPVIDATIEHFLIVLFAIKAQMVLAGEDDRVGEDGVWR